MGSHFEKWQLVWVVDLFPLSTNIIRGVVQFHPNKSFFLEGGNTEVNVKPLSPE